MKAAKWRDLSDDEVRQRARELAEEVFNLRFQLSTGVAKNPARIGQVRRDLARAHTILRERTGGVATVVREESPPAAVPAAEVKKKAARRVPRTAGRAKKTAATAKKK